MLYSRPQEISSAISQLTQSVAPCKVLAGGTDLLVQLKGEAAPPKTIVDLKALPGLVGIQEKSDAWHIGAATPGIEVTANKALKAAWPGLVEATGLIGSTQIQGRASIGGNLCNASPAADTIPALLAAGAKVLVEGPEGSREMPVEALLKGPGQTTLKAGDIVTTILLPKREDRAADAYLRFIPRTEMDIAVVSAGIHLGLDEAGRIATARVALGAVAPTAILVPEAAEALINSKLEEAALDALAKACEEAANPISDKRGTVAFRKRIAGVLACRAARIAYERAGGLQ